MMIPTVHLNGTSRGELIQQLIDAKLAIDNALTTLQRACPNGRDYYPQGQGAILRAQAEHAERCAKLGGVADELEQLAIAIQDA